MCACIYGRLAKLETSNGITSAGSGVREGGDVNGGGAAAAAAAGATRAEPAATPAPAPAPVSSPQQYKLTFAELCARSEAVPYKFPTPHNRIAAIVDRAAAAAGPAAADTVREEIATFAAGARPVIHSALIPVIKAFMAAKRESGAAPEQAIYNAPDALSVAGQIDRFVRKRSVRAPKVERVRKRSVVRTGWIGVCTCCGGHLHEVPSSKSEHRTSVLPRDGMLLLWGGLC